MVEQSSNCELGFFSDYPSATDTALSMGWRCFDEIMFSLQCESSSGFCALWNRLDRDSCNHCCGCVIRESFEE